MSNENQKRDNKTEKLKYLLDNRLGVLPDSISVTITNKMIEKCIIGFMEANGIDVGDSYNTKIAVACLWNERFKHCMQTGKLNGELPFYVSVLTRVNKADKTKAKTHHYQRLVNKLSQSDDGKACQLIVMNQPNLNKVLSKLAETVDGNNVGWRPFAKGRGKQNKRYKGILECPLNTWAVMQYIFATDNEEGRSIVYDFADVKSNKDGSFTLRVIKKFSQKGFKEVSGDLLRGLDRSRIRH